MSVYKGMQPRISIERLRLVSKARLARGKIRTASASDGVVDLAAAAELGLIENKGLIALLPEKIHARARKLLNANTLQPVKAKASTLEGTHRKKTEAKWVQKALATVIGPLYYEERRSAGVLLTNILKRQRFAKWVMVQMANDTSQLNKRLTRAGYAEICGLKRGQQWWERCLS